MSNSNTVGAEQQAERAQAYIDAFVERIDPISRALSLATWHYATSGEAQYKDEQVALQVELHTLFEGIYDDLPDWAEVQALHAHRAALPADLARQIEILYTSFLSNQSTAEENESLARLGAQVQEIYTNHRATVNGAPVSDNEITHILRTSTDEAERRASWMGSKAIGPKVVDLVRELARQRNAIAQRLGFRDYYAFSLIGQEIEEEMLFDLFGELERLTDAPYAAVKREMDQRLSRKLGVPVDELMPWHYADPFFQYVPPVFEDNSDALFADVDLVDASVRAYDRLGLEVRDVIERSDLYEREGKNQHAFCIRIGRSDDTRILCNLRPNARWMTTQMHELGHAIYNKYVPSELPYLLRTYAHISSTEASAMIMGRLPYESTWLRTVIDAPPERVEAIEGELSKLRSAGMLLFVRWVLVMLHFERALYADPDRADLNALWWELVERYQNVTPPAERNEPDWATKYHIALAPVYYHNYILGELTASQLNHWLASEGLSLIEGVGAGQRLVDGFFVHGARYPWDRLIEVTTGEPLQPHYLMRDFVD